MFDRDAFKRSLQEAVNALEPADDKGDFITRIKQFIVDYMNQHWRVLARNPSGVVEVANPLVEPWTIRAFKEFHCGVDVVAKFAARGGAVEKTVTLTRAC